VWLPLLRAETRPTGTALAVTIGTVTAVDSPCYLRSLAAAEWTDHRWILLQSDRRPRIRRWELSQVDYKCEWGTTACS
jgi:hypothetical protein